MEKPAGGMWGSVARPPPHPGSAKADDHAAKAFFSILSAEELVISKKHAGFTPVRHHQRHQSVQGHGRVRRAEFLNNTGKLCPEMAE